MMRIIVSKNIAALGLLAGGIAVWPAYADDPPFCPPGYITPSASELSYTVPDDSLPGIPYRWRVTLGSKDETNFGYYVGALSAYQPGFPPPDSGQPPEDVAWTHNTNWVALTLTSAAKVTIVVRPDVPVPCAPPSQPAACDKPDAKPNEKTGRTGSDLWPAISLYRGQDTTTFSSYPHVFNPSGNFWAKGLNYVDNTYKSDPETHMLTYTKYLKAGQYTINIGGAAARLP